MADESQAQIVGGAIMQEVMQKSCVHLAIGQEFIVTDESKVRLHISDWKNRIEAKNAWHTPLGLAATLFLGFFATDKFRGFGEWVNADTVKAFVALCFVASVVWLGRSIWRARSVPSQSVDSFVEELKRNATRIDISTGFTASTIQQMIDPGKISS